MLDKIEKIFTIVKDVVSRAIELLVILLFCALVVFV